MSAPRSHDRPERRAERLARHAAETDPDAVLAAAVRLLETAPRTIADLRARLTRAAWPMPLVERALERLTELGLLDDRAFARSWLESRDRARPRGERALRMELRRRGVDDQVVAAALAERRSAAALIGAEHDGSDAPSPGDAPSADERAAEHLLARRARALERLPNERTRRQWAYALLARNGFDPEVAAAVAARIGHAVVPAADPED